ncbi:MAG: acyltransferase [Candidatus Thiothrix sulfatifontis]|nr:MAG: acyltransferase [Candidatus Thiothrix sulfatifontis]
MRLRFINQRMFMWLVWFRDNLLWLRTGYFRKLYGMNIAPDVRISFKARLDKTNPRCIEIGEKTYIAFDSIILAHDYATRRHGGQFDQKTRIGANCFIGCGAIILPGVTIGDQVIVGAGSVVTKDVPAHSIVAGNPAKVVRSGIQTIAYGRLA